MTKIKTNEENKSNKALFIQRLLAFFIDVFIVSIVASIIAFPFLDNESLTKLNDSSNEVFQKYENGEISDKVYFTESMNISYQSAKKNGLLVLITIFLEILYFVVYQFYKGGQTIGKKLLKIQVVSTDKELTMNQMIIRSLIVDSILLDMIVMALVIFASKSVYLYGSLSFEVIQYIILFISCLMVMFSKSGRGIHDRLTHTEVIRKDS